MKTALQNAGLGTYYPTVHAMERIKARFGVPTDRVNEWIRRQISKARAVVSSKGSGGNTLVLESQDVRFIINRRSGAIITVYHPVRLDFLRPTLDREMRKIKRKYTREQRHLERILSEQYCRLGEQMMNYANARNPNTRELIGERIEATESVIEGYKQEIERIKDEMEVRIRAIEIISE